jgi:hypothetical protein
MMLELVKGILYRSIKLKCPVLSIFKISLFVLKIVSLFPIDFARLKLMFSVGRIVPYRLSKYVLSILPNSLVVVKYYRGV